MAEKEEKESSDVFIGKDKTLSAPEVKLLLELLKEKNPLLKSELSKTEIPYYVRAKAFTDILGLSFYDKVIDVFLQSKIAKDRQRVKELIQVMSKNPVQKKSGFSLFGGRKND